MSLDGGTLPAGHEAHSGEWECMECGYIEAGISSQRPKACPDCGAPTQAFEFFSDEDEGELDGEAPEGIDDVYEASVDSNEDDVSAH